MPANDRIVKQWLLELETGQSLREICPECGGGSSKERSLSITLSDSGYLLWNCYRASCGFSGARLAWGAVRGQGLKQKKAPRPFTGLLEPLPKAQVDWLYDSFRLRAPANWRWAPEHERLYLPILGPSGEHRGAILRDSTVRHEPKTLTFVEDLSAPFMHWAGYTGPKAPVIVEDMFSAEKVQQSGLRAVCLLGTHMGLANVREILSQFDCAKLALDKDAYGKAVRYAVEYKHLLNITVWSLEKDLKYVPEERILEAYYGGKTSNIGGD